VTEKNKQNIDTFIVLNKHMQRCFITSSQKDAEQKAATYAMNSGNEYFVARILSSFVTERAVVQTTLS
jgi:hypothetical protein